MTMVVLATAFVVTAACALFAARATERNAREPAPVATARASSTHDDALVEALIRSGERSPDPVVRERVRTEVARRRGGEVPPEPSPEPPTSRLARWGRAALAIAWLGYLLRPRGEFARADLVGLAFMGALAAAWWWRQRIAGTRPEEQKSPRWPRWFGAALWFAWLAWEILRPRKPWTTEDAVVLALVAALVAGWLRHLFVRERQLDAAEAANSE